MKRGIILIFYILSLFLHTVCFGQSAKISGRLSFEDGSPVAYATVIVHPIKKYALSDGEGRYEIKEVPYGYYEVEVSSLEIQKQRYTLSVGSELVSLPLVFKKAEARVLSEVVVEAESEKKIIETSGFAANVIETKEAGIRNIQTNELLDRSVGIRVRQNGGLGSAVNYNLNGMSGHSIRIFIDGIPLNTYGPSFSLNSIPPALIERIEVYKGVVPAHLADDALGGAINVVLKQNLRNNLTASVSYGSFNTLQSHLSGMFRNEKTGFAVKVSAFYNHSDNDYEVWGKFVRNILPNGRYEYVRARRFNDAYRAIGGQVELGFTDVKWADQFFIGFNASDDHKEIQHGMYMSIPYMGRFSTSQAQVLTMNYRKADVLTKGLELTFSGMYSQRHQVVNDTVRWNYNWFGERSIGLNGDPILRPSGAQQGAPTINHINRNVATFRVGLNYDFNSHHRIVLNHIFYTIDRREQDQMRSMAERDFIGTRDLQKNITSLAYETTTLRNSLKTSFFAKYYQQSISRMNPVLVNVDGQPTRQENRMSNSRAALGYGVAVSYAITRKWMVLASAEKAIRMPSEEEIFGSPADNITENINLSAEQSNNLNAGFKFGPYIAGNHKVSLNATGFLRDTRDKIVQQINPRLNDAIQTNPFENLGKTKAIGFEGELFYTYNKNLNVVVNFSKFNAVFNMEKDPNGRVYDHYNRQLPNEPFFTVNASLQYALHNLIAERSTINFYYSFGFVERFYTTWLLIEDFRTPRQHIHDLGLNYIFPNKKFVLSADAKNILNAQVYDNFAVQKPGRAFYLKLNYTISNF
ncbi:TonB-dependent receptor [Eisenibacter elegans]|uniref:TonB-dependent receptor n=1 Tax=Eisenibacter elegans TaxID=997 RepID=UPI0004259CB9|nr:TonB-dependent receptor plug domain-containing protein [Eisenibacter elegans]